MRKLTKDLACRLRVQGLSLPAGDDIEYETPELKAIAQERHKLMERLDALDRQLFGDSYANYQSLP